MPDNGLSISDIARRRPLEAAAIASMGDASGNGTDVLHKVRAMQKRAADSGKYGYSSVFAEAADEISRLRVALAKTPQGWTPGGPK